jgi:hypothetical protein
MNDIFAKLPRKWKVGSYTFNVMVVPAGTAVLDEADGITHMSAETVHLDASMTPMRASVVVLHEAIHIINWVFGVTDGSDEETIATQVSTGLLAFWHDNPKVMQWINRTRQIHE